jgi:DNA repair exonuclease SbcCD ATPase subunit
MMLHVFEKIKKNFMRLKSFNQFIGESEEVSKGEMLQFQLRNFNVKKNNLKKLIMSNIDTDKDIEKNYEDIVEENPFLQSYGTILKIEADILKKENKLKETEETIQKLNDDLKLVNRLSDDTDKETQTQNLNQQIEDKKKTIEEDQESIEELKDRQKEMEEDLKKMIKNKEEELNNIQNDSVFENLFLDNDDYNKDIQEQGYGIDQINSIKNLCKEANYIWSYLSREDKKEVLNQYNIKEKIGLDLSSLPFEQIEPVCNYVIKNYGGE